MATKAENFAKQQEMLKNAWVDINKYNAAIAWWASTVDALKAGWYTWTTKTNTSTQTSSWLNAVSQSSLDVNKNKAQVWTWAVAAYDDSRNRMNELNQKAEEVKTMQQDLSNQLAKKRNWLDYDTQQKRLNAINWLKEWLASKWITSKTQPTTQTTTTTPTKTTTTTKATTPKQDQWDYQDNSQARMDQIADNLDKYRQSQPWLFEDASAFYNFFIDWKGRSQDQIDYLWDYFNRVQKFWKYDNLPASTIWDMLANWKLWDDYLNYLKTTDPAKYQEALSYRQDAEDTIKYESFLSDTADQAGLSWFEKFYKWIFGYRDENDDKIDDSLYIAPTEEEQTKQNRVNTIDSRIMEIKNMQKNLLDDLVEQYPWVPKATLMWIVQDRTKDLQREYDDLMVERTWLVWNIEYMQNERNAQMDARQNTINNTQKALSTYYSYTPEWISELTQSKYAAENVTLDQADQWTETQKQMAVQSALSDYMDKYWDIIQRSEAQIINDVIAYSKKNWVWLAQAFQENFVDQLKKKPEYQAMQNQLVDNWWDIKNIYVNWEQQSVWYNPYTQETKPVWYSYNSSTWTYDLVSMNDRWEWEYFDKREAVQNNMRVRAEEWWDLEWAAKNIAANMEGAYLWLSTCWYYVNDYIYWITWTKWPFGSEIQSKRDACNNKNWLVWAKVWDAVVFDWTIAWWVNWVYPEYWHVGIITAKYDDWSIDVSSSISWKVQTRHIKPWDAWYNNIYGTRSLKYSWAEYWYWENPMSSYFAKLWWWDLNADQKKDLKFVTQSYNLLYRIASSWDLDHLINSWDFEKLVQNMNSKAFQSTEWDKTFSAIKSMLTKNISDQTNLKTIWDIAELITLKLRKESWAAISAWEWASWFESFLPWAWEDYNTSFAKYIRFEQDYLMPSMVYAWWDMSDYKPLFSPNSPYYKRDDSTTWLWTAWVTSKWNWNFAGSWAGSTVWTSTSPYSSLFNQLNIW